MHSIYTFPKRAFLCLSGKSQKIIGLLGLIMILGVSQLSAHVTEIRVNQNQDGTLTWYLQTYHQVNECGHSNAGLSINGVKYNIDAEFSGSIAGLSSTVVAASNPSPDARGRNSYATVHTPYIPGTLNVAPYSNNVCWAFLVGGNSSFNPPPPPVCTTATIVGVSSVVSLSGSNNGSPCDPTDDHTTAVVTVNHLACANITGNKQFSVIYDVNGANVAYGPYNYNSGTSTSVTINIPYGASTSTQVKAFDGFPSSAQSGLSISGGQYLGQRERVPPVVAVPANATIVNTPGKCGSTYAYTVNATDNCSVSSLVQIAGLPSGSVFPVGTTVNTFKATDPSGNSAIATFSVTVNDTEAPIPSNYQTGSKTISIPAFSICCWNSGIIDFMDPLPAGAEITGTNITYSGQDQGWGGTGDYNSLKLQGTQIGSNQYFHYTQNYSDNYNGSIPGYVSGGINHFQMNFTGYPGWQGFFNGGTLTLNYVIKSLPALTAECSLTAPVPTANDNCDGLLNGTTTDPTTFTAQGTYNINWTYTDSKGNTSTQSQAVIIKDITAPVISGMPANITQSNDLGVCGAKVSWTIPTATDNCNLASFVSDHQSGDLYPIGNTVVTYTAKDLAGNTTTASFTVTINDTEVPTISTTDVAVNNDNGVCGASITLATPVTKDNCGVQGVTNDHPSNVYPVGTTKVNWTVTDVNGNSASAVQTVVVTDNEKPTISTTDVAVNNDNGACSATITLAAPVTKDNCGVQSVTNDHPSTVYPVGTTTVNWTVTDVNGNSASTVQTVVVTDNEKPTITTTDVTVNNDNGVCGATITLAAPVTKDNCGVQSVTNDHASTSYPVGTTVVTWTVTDIHGLTNTATQSVTVNDNEKPTISVSNVSVNNDLGICGANVSLVSVTGDNCQVASVTNDHPSTLFPVGTTTVNWLVKDIHGNTNTAVQTVTVTDNEAPVVHTKNISVTLVGGTVSITAAQVDNGSTDNCAIASMSVSPSTFVCGQYGNNTVTLTVTDIHGLTSSATAVVNVIGVKPLPSIAISRTDNTFTGLPANTIALGYGAQNLTLKATDGSQVTAGTTTYVWSSSNGLSGLSSTTSANPVFTPTAAGNYTFTVTATNQYGCVNTTSVLISVVDVRCGNKNDKVIVCHKTGSSSNPTVEICISTNAVATQLSKGDNLGHCAGTFTKTASSQAHDEQAKKLDLPKELTVVASPNPTSNYFTLTITSNDVKTSAVVKVVDAAGRPLQQFNQVMIGTSVTFGHTYTSGSYYAEISQGAQHKVIKLMKMK